MPKMTPSFDEIMSHWKAERSQSSSLYYYEMHRKKHHKSKLGFDFSTKRQEINIRYINYAILTESVFQTAASTCKRINVQRANVTDISDALRARTCPPHVIEKFEKDMETIFQYYSCGIDSIKEKIGQFAKVYKERDKGIDQTALDIRTQCVGQMELLSRDFDTKVGLLDTYVFVLKRNNSLSNDDLKFILKIAKIGAQEIIDKELEWKRPEGSAYPLCARVIAVDLWPTESHTSF